MKILKMEDLDLSGKRVLIREDFNVPISNGQVANDTRIQAAIPTIKLANRSAKKIILMSHLGRPIEGKSISEQLELSLAPVATHLSNALDKEVLLIDSYIESPKFLNRHNEGIFLLENIRINLGEKSNDYSLGKTYADMCDVFVMDAFGTAHRAQASTYGVSEYAASACAGPLLSKELDALERSLTKPSRPLLAVVGGSKVSTKLEVLKELSKKVDQLIVGGGIANTFLFASGINIGNSLCEPALAETAKYLMRSTNIPLPIDVVTAKEFNSNAKAQVKMVSQIDSDDYILDIGPQTADMFSQLISSMKTIIWNGPVGVFEFPQFSDGTCSVALAIAKSKGFSLAGGGETIAAIDKFGVTNQISYISTGGGAFLEYIQGAKLPAVEILKKRSIAN